MFSLFSRRLVNTNSKLSCTIPVSLKAVKATGLNTMRSRTLSHDANNTSNSVTENKLTTAKFVPTVYVWSGGYVDFYRDRPGTCTPNFPQVRPVQLSVKAKMSVTTTPDPNVVKLTLTSETRDDFKNYEGQHISCYERNVKNGQTVTIEPFNQNTFSESRFVFFRFTKLQENRFEVIGQHTEKVNLCLTNQSKPCYEATLPVTPPNNTYVLNRKDNPDPSDSLPCREYPAEPKVPHSLCLTYKK